MTFSQVLNMIAAAMLGGGISLIGTMIAIYFTNFHKKSNGKTIASQVVMVLTALMELIRNRGNIASETENIAELLTGIRMLIETFKTGEKDKTLQPVVKVEKKDLTTSIVVNNIPATEAPTVPVVPTTEKTS